MKEIDDVWRGWFVGFVDGEGCFLICKYNYDNPRANYRCRFTIGLRDDDRAILEEIRETLGLGTIYDYPANISDGRNTQPSTAFYVCAIKDCAALVTLFETYPLRAKKRQDFDVWKLAVAEQSKPVDERDPLMLDYYFHKIREVRKYDEQAELSMPKIKELQLIIKYEDE